MGKVNYICIEGNIASGKTTVLNFLAERIKINRICERVPNEELVGSYYSNQLKNVLLLEFAFLGSRYKQLLNEINSNELNVSDFSFFRSKIISRITLNNSEFKVFNIFFDILKNLVPQPELLIYLNVPPEKLLKNLINRGHDFEKEIKIDYLQQVSESYNSFFAEKKDVRKVLINIGEKDIISDLSVRNFLLDNLIDAIYSDVDEVSISL